MRLLLSLPFFLAAPAALAAPCTVGGTGFTHTSLQNAVDDVACTSIDVAQSPFKSGVRLDRPMEVSSSINAELVPFIVGEPMFHVLPGGALDLHDIQLTDGDADEGAGVLVEAGGSLTAERVSFLDNTAKAGAAVYLVGAATLTDCLVADNLGLEDGGALAVIGGDLLLRQSMVRDNSVSSSWDDGGALYVDDGGKAVVRATVLRGNSATFGGAVAVRDGTASIFGSRLAFNNSEGYGSAIYAGEGADVLVSRSVVRANNSQSAGTFAVQYTGELTVVNSTFSANLTDNGGSAVASMDGGVADLRFITARENVGSGGGTPGTFEGSLLRARAGSIGVEHSILGGTHAPWVNPACFAVGGGSIQDYKVLNSDGTCALDASSAVDWPRTDPWNGQGYPLRPASRANNVAVASECPGRDQVWNRRTGPCDLGALESP